MSGSCFYKETSICLSLGLSSKETDRTGFPIKMKTDFNLPRQAAFRHHGVWSWKASCLMAMVSKSRSGHGRIAIRPYAN
jgi:hypothetical protein